MHRPSIWHRSSTWHRSAHVAIAALALSVAGCAADDEPATSTSTVTEAPTTAPTTSPTTTVPAPPVVIGVSVPDALAQDLTGEVTLSGYLYIDQGAARLCTELLEIEPPACGGMSVSVAGSVDTPVMLDSGTGIRWSPFPIDLSGSFSGSKLVANGPPPQLVALLPPTTTAPPAAP